MRRLTFFLSFLLLSAAVRADDCACAKAPPAPTTPTTPTAWAGTVAGGYVRSSGNTDTSTENLKFELDYTDLPWANELTGSTASGRSSDKTTVEQYSLGDKTKFSFNEVDYAFGDVVYDNDRFSGIIQSYSESAGYGRRLLMLEHQTLDAELGAGASELREQGGSDFAAQVILTIGGKYVYTFSPTSQFTQTLRTEIGPNNTFIDPVSQLTLHIVGQLLATLNYELRYNTSVPDNTHHTDIITSVNLGYSFGKKP